MIFFGITENMLMFLGSCLGDGFSSPLNFALRSRLLITTVPSSMYVFNEDGTNLTLQAAAEIIVDSFNQLSTDGVTLRDASSDEVFADLT